MDWYIYGNETLKGWKTVIHPLIDYCKEHNISIFQIKEKFGGLRFYTGPASDEFYDMLSEAEKKASTMCEYCGKNATMYNRNGWMTTLCEDHAKEFKADKDFC